MYNHSRSPFRSLWIIITIRTGGRMCGKIFLFSRNLTLGVPSWFLWERLQFSRFFHPQNNLVLVLVGVFEGALFVTCFQAPRASRWLTVASRPCLEGIYLSGSVLAYPCLIPERSLPGVRFLDSGCLGSPTSSLRLSTANELKWVLWQHEQHWWLKFKKGSEKNTGIKEGTYLQ